MLLALFIFIWGQLLGCGQVGNTCLWVGGSLRRVADFMSLGGFRANLLLLETVIRLKIVSYVNIFIFFPFKFIEIGTYL